MQYTVSYWCASHIGKLRSVNQDNFICDGQFMELNHESTERPLTGTRLSRDFSLFGIYDGMGGEECGEIASHIAAKNAALLTSSKDAVATLSQFCQAANAEICSYAKESGISAMGTTAAMLAFTSKKITLCNIGDSKIFRFCGGTLEQISKDHVAISAFGKKPPLSQNLGIPPTELLIEPYISQGRYQNGDLYLICSDGLTDMVSNAEITQILDSGSPYESADALLERALQAGGRDNVTIILLEVKKRKRELFHILRKDNGGRKV